MKKLCILTSIGVWVLSGFMNPDSRQADLEGHWISTAPEKTTSGNFGIREFTFYKSKWEVKSTIYLDSLLQYPVFTFRAIGQYALQDPATLHGAQNAIFRFTRKYLTARTKNNSVLRKAGMGDCILPFAHEVDITETGCGYLVSKKICAEEFDLIHIKRDTLLLGARPASGGMCTEDKRPVSLGRPLKRIK